MYKPTKIGLLAGLYLPLQAPSIFAAGTVTLEQMNVTATRSATPIDQLSSATTVYTRSDIDRLQIHQLPDLLRATAGIDIVQNGGIGTNTSVFMRGTNSDHVLVLVDGIKVGSASLGTTAFQFVPLDRIERIEIIRGPQSALYGSEAIGGVIQIFTRKGGDTESPLFSLQSGGGSYATYQVDGNVDGKLGDMWYGLGVSSNGTDGIDARQPIPGAFGFSQPDRDGYQNTALNARAGYRFGDDGEIEASFIRAEGTQEFDSNFGGDRADFLTQTVALSGAWVASDAWRSTLHLGQSLDDNDTYFSSGVLDSRFHTTRWNASWINEVTLTETQHLVVGADYRLDEVDSTVAYSETSRYDTGIFAEYHGEVFDGHYLHTSLRWDENEQFGDFFSGSIGWRGRWDSGISTFANFGNAFKAPTFNDLYFPNYGNADLQPEESTSVEIGVGGEHDWGRWEIRAYHTEIDNLITPVADAFFNYTAQNVGSSQIDGLEIEVAAEWLGWTGQLNLNLLDPEIKETGKRLPRRTDKSLAFDLSRTFGSLDVGGRVIAQDYRFDNTQNSIKVGGFVTVDLRAAYRIGSNWTLNGQFNNILDETYQTVDTYNTLGRTFFLSVRYDL